MGQVQPISYDGRQEGGQTESWIVVKEIDGSCLLVTAAEIRGWPNR